MFVGKVKNTRSNTPNANCRNTVGAQFLVQRYALPAHPIYGSYLFLYTTPLWSKVIHRLLLPGGRVGREVERGPSPHSAFCYPVGPVWRNQWIFRHSLYLEYFTFDARLHEHKRPFHLAGDRKGSEERKNHGLFVQPNWKSVFYFRVGQM